MQEEEEVESFINIKVTKSS